jgi:hypothetical protein
MLAHGARDCEKIGWHAEAPAPQKRKPLWAKVGQTLSSVSPATPVIFSRLLAPWATFFRSCGASPRDVTAMSRLTVPGKPFPTLPAIGRLPFTIFFREFSESIQSFRSLRPLSPILACYTRIRRNPMHTSLAPLIVIAQRGISPWGGALRPTRVVLP